MHLKGVKILPRGLANTDQTQQWEKILSIIYKKPSCPFCKEELSLEVLRISHSIECLPTIENRFTIYDVPFGEDCNLEFLCTHCKCKINCRGIGLDITPGEGMTFERILSYEITKS